MSCLCNAPNTVGCIQCAPEMFKDSHYDNLTEEQIKILDEYIGDYVKPTKKESALLKRVSKWLVDKKKRMHNV